MLYAAFLGTIGSIVGHSYIAISHKNGQRLRSLSELAATDSHLLQLFRFTAFTNSTLLAITVYGFIAPRNDYGLAQSIAWSIEYLCGILMLIFPARGSSLTFHNVSAISMAVGMYLLCFLFLPVLDGIFHVVLWGCACAMTAFGAATFLDDARYMLYELCFIFTSHITICVAALGML